MSSFIRAAGSWDERSSTSVAPTWLFIIGGRSGTLGEFSIAYDEGKLIGVLLGTGGITTAIKYIVKTIKKKTGARILYDENPRTLVKRLVRYYRKIHYRHPSIHHIPEMSMP